MTELTRLVLPSIAYADRLLAGGFATAAFKLAQL